MSDVADLIADMVRAGVDPDLIGRAAAAIADRQPAAVVDEQAERRRAKDRDRKRLRNSAESADSEPLSSPEGFSPTPPFPKPHQSIPPSPPKGGSSPTDRAIEIFSEVASQAGFPVPRKVTADRRRKIQARLREHGDEAWAEACRRMAASAFCRGENDRGWRADLDFLCQSKSFNGLIEGKYDDRPKYQSQGPPARKSAFQQHQDECQREIDRALGRTPDDEFAGNTLDLGARDYHPH